MTNLESGYQFFEKLRLALNYSDSNSFYDFYKNYTNAPGYTDQFIKGSPSPSIEQIGYFVLDYQNVATRGVKTDPDEAIKIIAALTPTGTLPWMYLIFANLTQPYDQVPAWSFSFYDYKNQKAVTIQKPARPNTSFVAVQAPSASTVATLAVVPKAQKRSGYDNSYDAPINITDIKKQAEYNLGVEFIKKLRSALNPFDQSDDIFNAIINGSGSSYDDWTYSSLDQLQNFKFYRIWLIGSNVQDAINKFQNPDNAIKQIVAVTPKGLFPEYDFIAVIINGNFESSYPGLQIPFVDYANKKIVLVARPTLLAIEPDYPNVVIPDEQKETYDIGLSFLNKLKSALGDSSDNLIKSIGYYNTIEYPSGAVFEKEINLLQASKNKIFRINELGRLIQNVSKGPNYIDWAIGQIVKITQKGLYPSYKIIMAIAGNYYNTSAISSITQIDFSNKRIVETVKQNIDAFVVPIQPAPAPVVVESQAVKLSIPTVVKTVETPITNGMVLTAIQSTPTSTPAPIVSIAPTTKATVKTVKKIDPVYIHPMVALSNKILGIK